MRDGRARPSEIVRNGEAGTILDYGRWPSETITDGEISDGEPSEVVRDGRARASETVRDGRARASETVRDGRPRPSEIMGDGRARPSETAQHRRTCRQRS